MKKSKKLNIESFTAEDAAIFLKIWELKRFPEKAVHIRFTVQRNFLAKIPQY